ncbi:MAG: membrane dipeptidase [Dongiaceae bacterium]
MGIYLDATAPMLQPRDLPRRLPDLVAGGVDAALATVGAIEDFRTTMEVLAKWLAIERAGAQKIRIARSVADIRAAKAAGKTAIVVHFQGADPIEDELDFLDIFHACGLRVMQVTYNSRNRLGDGCFEPTDAGLSKFGRQAIARMEALGIAVDLSHAGVRTQLESIEHATKPVLVTHANVRALCDTPRNLTDEVIRAVGSKGGVIGACAVPFFLDRQRRPSLDTLIDQVDYLADKIGARQVGLGFDFAEEDEDDYVYFGYDERYIPKPPWIWPTGLTGHAEAGNVAAALSRRGYSDADIAGILGENFLRVFAELWGG